MELKDMIILQIAAQMVTGDSNPERVNSLNANLVNKLLYIDNLCQNVGTYLKSPEHVAIIIAQFADQHPDQDLYN